MLNLQKTIALKKQLDTFRPLKKEDEQRIMQKFRLDWNYHSNNLEGNSLTYGETKALILFGITAQGKPLKDHFEVTGHDEAIKWIEDIVKEDRPLSENFIRELHQLILKESYEINVQTPEGLPAKKHIQVGVYKTSPNHVLTQTGEIFRFATPEETPAKMADLVAWYRTKSETTDVNPILLAAEFHYRYIRIHPFDDGNGRTARILMNFILMKFGYPPVVIKTEDKENYFAALRQADAGNLEAFVEYIAVNLNHSLELMLKGAKGESIEDPSDLDKQIALLERKLDGTGDKIEKTLSEEVLEEFGRTTLLRIAEKFVAMNEKFERFYVKKNYVIRDIEKDENGETIFGEQYGEIYYVNRILFESMIDSEIPDIFKEGIKNILEIEGSSRIGFYVGIFNETFNRELEEQFDYESLLEFQFNKTNYEIIYNENQTLQKLYNQTLTDQEIDQIMSEIAKKHLAFIEEKLK